MATPIGNRLKYDTNDSNGAPVPSALCFADRRGFQAVSTLASHLSYWFMSTTVSVTFEVGYLRKLALKEAENIPEMKGEKLSSVEVFNPCNDDQLDGIMVFFEQPEEDLQ